MSLLRVEHVTALCLPEQQARLDVIFRQLAISRGMVAARRLADILRPLHAAVYGAGGADAVRGLPLPCAVKCWMKSRSLSRVGAASRRWQRRSCTPRLLAIHYDGVSDGPVRCYVGKGITFDTGGLWLAGWRGHVHHEI